MRSLSLKRILIKTRERSGSVVVLDSRPTAGVESPASLRCGPYARHIYPSLVLVKPRKIRPYITERLLMGRKESNQTKKVIKTMSSLHQQGNVSTQFDSKLSTVGLDCIDS